MELQDIFEELNEVRLCKSAYDFSTNYLGKSKSYYSVLKANKSEPSICTLAVLETALEEQANDYDNDKYEVFAARRNQLLSLSDRVRALRQQHCMDRIKQLKGIL